MRSFHKGFTLIEALLGVSIFSIIALCVLGIFQGAMQIKQRLEDQGAILREARWAFMRVNQDLKNMAPYDFSGSAPHLRACVGGKDKISFLKLSDQGLRVVSYYLAPPEKIFVRKTLLGKKHRGNQKEVSTTQESLPEMFLAREEKSLSDYWEGKESSPEEREVLSVHIKKDGLGFFYAQAKEASDEIEWKGLWEQNELPRGVRVHLSFQAQDSSKDFEFFEDIFIPSGGR